MRKVWVLIVAGILYFIGLLLYDSGVFKTIKNINPGESIKIYREAFGTEDIDLDDTSGTLFISSTNRWAQRAGDKTEGRIYSLQIDSGETLLPIPHTLMSEFNPHGISLYKSDTTDYLFVINHNYDGNFIERFRYFNDTLIHEKTYSDEMMHSPNDLVAIDTDKFYVTNDHGSTDRTWRMIEDYLRVPMSYALYYDGEYFSKVVESVNYANGINVSNDGSRLYLTATTSGDLFTYKRYEDTGELELLNTIDLKTGVDNIHVDANDDIWIGAHPKLLDFVAHSSDPIRMSPSEVIRLSSNDSGGYNVDQIYLNDGSEISGSSVAVPYGKDLFVGVVFENKVLRIKLK